MAAAATLDSASSLIEGGATVNDKVEAADDAEDAQETFHDACESVRSGASSSLASPTMKGHDGPNTSSEAGFTPRELTEDTTNEESDPTPRPLALPAWDKFTYASHSPDTSPSTPEPSSALVRSTVDPKSPLRGATLRQSSTKDLACGQYRRSLEMKDLPASSMKAESPDHGAFWQQLKLKFSKRTAKDASELSPALPLPPPDSTGHTSPLLQSPPASAYKVSLLPIHKQTRDTSPSGIAPAVCSPWGKDIASANEHGHVNDPLFQVLPASTSPKPTTGIDCAHPSCPAVSSLQIDNQSRQPLNLNRRSFELPVNCPRAPSIRRLKKRSASIRRKSLSVNSYKLASPIELAEYIHQACTTSKPIIVLDIRSALTYMSSTRRLHSSMNVTIPSLLAKRFRQGNYTSFSLKSFLQDDRSKEIYAELCPDDRWQGHQICVVDDAIKDTDFLAPNGNNTAATLVSALAGKQAEEMGPSRPIYVLQGRLTDLIEHASKLSGRLVDENTQPNSPIKATSSIAGMAGGQLFTTPSIMSSTTSSQSLDTALWTARPREPNGGRDAPSFAAIKSPILEPTVPRKLRPLQLQRLDTSGIVKRTELDSHETSTPRGGLTRSHPQQALSSSTATFGATPESKLPLSAFVHTGISAPSRLPTIVMPLDGQMTPRGGATFQVSVIIPGFLYLGPEPLQEEDVEELESVGIKRILNVATECDTQDRWRGRFEKIASIPMRDSLAEPNVQARFEEACSLLDDADLLGRPTYVHCKAGKSRSVTITLAYLIHRNHWPLKRAYAHVLDRRQGVCPNIGFVAELMRFEETELGGRSRGILGTGSTPAHDQAEYFAGNRNAPTGPSVSEGKPAVSAIPRTARSDLEGRPTVVRHLSFIASTALGINNEKPRTRDQRSSTHVARNRDSMPPGIGYSHYDSSLDKPGTDN